jgi:ABC-type antimicrobial peptide transport system permease subunit
MSIKDYFKMSLLNLFRDKKKIGYILITFICVILCTALLTFSHNLETLLNVTISKNLGYRSLTTMPRIEDPEAEVFEYDLEKDVKDLLSIEHVVDVFSQNYRNVIIYDTDLKNENLDGAVTLNRATSKTLPLIIAGRGFEEGERGVAICPKKFYPSTDPLFINKDYLLDGYKLLNTTFNVEFYNYISDGINPPVKNEKFTKSFRIIGLYDTSQVMADSTTCYVQKEDIMEISDTQDSQDDSMVMGLDVVIDDVKNMEYVNKKMESAGFELIEQAFKVDMNFVTMIRLSIAAILSIVLFTIVILTSSYTKKKINREEKTIGVLRACGYSKKVIKLQYIMELLITNLFIFALGLLVFLIIYYFALENVGFLVGLNLMIGVRIGLFTILLSLLLTVGLPCLIISRHISRKCKLNIVELIGNEE